MMFLGVALGAFGSHILKAKVNGQSLEVYKTGIHYHLVHALGLFVVAWVSTVCSDPRVHWAGVFLIAGILLFSGSLYLLAVSGQKWWGAITPLGGLSFLAAWTILFACLLSK